MKHSRKSEFDELDVFRQTTCRYSIERAHAEQLQTHHHMTATSALMIVRRCTNCRQQVESQAEPVLPVDGDVEIFNSANGITRART